MKKKLGFFLFVLVFPALINAEANREIPRVLSAVPNAEKIERNVYAISADPGTETLVTGLRNELELRFNVYNRLFRFDPSQLPPLNVRIINSKEAYDRYVTSHLGAARAGAVYIHYSQAERRELVIFSGILRSERSPEEASALAHQVFIQYFRGFVAHPPSWMTEGFGIFFSTLYMNPGGTLGYEENLSWLESAKRMGNRMLSVETILQNDIQRTPYVNSEEFRVSSWALVSFLLNGGRDYFRSLTDSFMVLSSTADNAGNSRAVMDRISRWNDFSALNRDLKAYIDSRRTFKELMDDGRSAYSRGDMMSAEFYFLSAMDQHPQDSAPYYYLGLLSYEDKNYEEAERYYLSSLERGNEDAIIYYALGVNAAAAGRKTNAADYLHKAAAMDPARYRARVEELLRKIWE